MSALTTAPTPTTTGLRRLYAGRFVFALVWALLVVASGPDLDGITAGLLVLYPLVDVAATVVAARSGGWTRGAVLNVGVGLAAAAGLAIAAASGTPAVLRVWGAWAIASGVIQLVAAVRHRGAGGRWPLIVSGGLSAVAGTAFVLMAGQDGAQLTALGAYAVPGGVFFLLAALRLGRAARD